MTKPSGGSGRLGGMRYRLRLLPAGLVLLVAACSAAPAASVPGSSPGATTPAASPTTPAPSPSLTLVPSGQPGIGTLYTGILSFDAIEGGCTYLQAADGQRLQVLYPDGWELKKTPLELIAPDGSVHSRGGDRVTVRGEEADMASICQIGPIIQATEVIDR